jgi:hypothetical protein
MAYEYEKDGTLKTEVLSAQERKELFEIFSKRIESLEQSWSDKYGPFEDLRFGMTAQEVDARLDEVDDSYIWSDVTYHDSQYLEIIPGLVVYVSGWAYVAGRDTYASENENDDYLIASKPWIGDAYDYYPVFHLAKCICPFCIRGKLKDDNCDVCMGEGEMEVYL